MSLSQADNIEIRIVQEKDADRVLAFIRKYFFPDEPLTTGSEPKDQIETGGEFIVAQIPHGTSLMAVIKDTDELVGVSVTGPKGPDEAAILEEHAIKEGDTKFGRILKFLAYVEQESNVYERYKVDRVLHILATCVDAKQRGKNIGSRLYKGVAELGKKLGYDLLTSDCTSFYSARIKERLGWDFVNAIYYKNYLDENKQQVFRPDPPHVGCKTYAVRL